jgi:hypothetical protein
MQLAESLCPVHEVSERRSGSYRYAMLLGLHGLLLSLAVSEGGIHTYRVSQVNQKITKCFSEVLLECIVQLKKCNCSVSGASWPFSPAFPLFLSSSPHLALHSSVSATSHVWGFPFCTAFVHQVSNELFNNLVAHFVGCAGPARWVASVARSTARWCLPA